MMIFAMKRAIQFLTSELLALHREFGHLEIKYEYRPIVDIHIVQINPSDSFSRDTSFSDQQLRIEERFRLRFPMEEILFMAENVFIQVSHPLLVLRGGGDTQKH